MADSPDIVAHQFDDAAQQHESSTLGMWVFLATEIMFFGGLFTGYTIYRATHAAAFAAASQHLEMPLGALNTAVLLTSSLTMALAVHGAQVGERRRTVAVSHRNHDAWRRFSGNQRIRIPPEICRTSRAGLFVFV